MIAPKIPAEEPQRLKSLYHYKILDTPPEPEFDELAKLASQICGTPISLVTLVDVDRQWFKANVGLKVDQTSREVAFCAHAIHYDDMFMVRDAAEDERFRHNPLVTGSPNIRFYAGMPLITPSGHKLGTLCVIDTVPRELTDEQMFALRVLSRQVIQQMELKLHNRQLEKSIQKISRQNVELNRLNKVSNKLISIISHDLRNPITTLKGFLTLLENDQLDKIEINQFIDGISTLLDSSSDLLDNLIQWGVRQMDDEEVKVQSFRLDLLVQEVMQHLRLNAQFKNNELIHHLEAPSYITADSTMIRFVIRNLLQNSIKFTANGTIEVHASEDDASYYIKVQDTGCGIHPNQLNDLFNWDIKVSTCGTAGEKGAGLGLVICKEFVEKHHGKIGVSSQLGKGSIFTFSISKELCIDHIGFL